MLRLHHTPNFQEIFSTIIQSPPPGITPDLHIISPRNKRSSSSNSRRFLLVLVSAAEKDSEFQVDTVKAREALRKLDEDFISSISQKRNEPMKITSSDLDRIRGPITEGSEEISGTSLATLATGLLIFTIFYNIFFLTVIKPAIDGPADIKVTVTGSGSGSVLEDK